MNDSSRRGGVCISSIARRVMITLRRSTDAKIDARAREGVCRGKLLHAYAYFITWPPGAGVYFTTECGV